MNYSLNCLPILIIIMYIKTSYDFLDLEYMGVDLKLQRTLF